MSSVEEIGREPTQELPPLALKDVQFFPRIRKELLALKLNKSFEAISKKRQIYFQTYTRQDYQKIKGFLQDRQYQFQ